MFHSQKQVPYETPSCLVFERKFDIALRSSFLDGLRYRIKTNTTTRMDKLLTTSNRVDGDLLNYSRDITHWPKILQRLLKEEESTKWAHRGREKFNSIWDIISSVISIQWGYIMESDSTPNAVSKLKLMYQFLRENRSEHSLLHRLADLMTFLSETVEKSNLIYKRERGIRTDTDWIKTKCQSNFANYPELDLTFVWNHELLVINISTQWYIAPRHVLLMLHNKVSDLISILTCIELGKGSTFSKEFPHDVREFLQIMTTLAIQYKQKFFDIARSLEGLCTAETLVSHEDWKNREFLEALSNNLYESTGFTYMESDLRVLLSQLDTPDRHEISCLSKVFGHPYVDMQLGSEKLYKNTTEIYEINLMLVQRCINYIKQNYICNHIATYGRWPPCHLISSTTPKALAMAFLEHKNPHSLSIKNRFGEVAIEDYAYIELDVNMRFEKLENVIPHLKDKTISLLRSAVIKTYLEKSHTGSRPNWKDTRLLLSYLLNPTMVHDHVQYLEEFTQSEDLSELLNYLCIRIVPKEGELKVAYRGFGCKTYEDRMRALAQEKNVMRFLDQFSDEQAMTLGELDIFRRLSALRRLKSAYTAHEIIHIVVDASAWNNHFRSETVDFPMEHTLDKVFGTKIFSKTHKAYEKTLMFVPDHGTTYSWEGQGGGIEGLNQDTWVVVYLAQIKTALDPFGYKYHIFCKGDDLRVSLAIPKTVLRTTSMLDIKNNLVKAISTTMKEFGHKINVEESYGSSKFYAFSKIASLGTVELPQTLRKIQKVYGANNAFIPTLDDYIASTFSNAHSACKVSPCVVPCYGTACFWSVFYLKHSEYFKDMTNTEIAALLLIPSMLGGFPIIYLHNMYVRAESDLLSPFLGLLDYCKRLNPDIYEVMRKFMNVAALDKVSIPQLFRDPYSLPITRPPLPSFVLRSYIKPALEKLVKNEDVLELFECLDSPVTEQLNSCLASATPFDAKVLAGLYAATPGGILDELLRKFESSRSVFELLILRMGKRRSENVLRKVIKSEHTLQSWRRLRIKDRLSEDTRTLSHLYSPCPAQFAQRIRDFSWNKKIKGVTMPPLQHQILFIPAYPRNANSWERNNHFTYHVSAPIEYATKHIREQYSCGAKDPFIGYTTRTGTVEPTVHFVEKDVIIQKLKNLIDLTSWTDRGLLNENGEFIASNAREVIKVILSMYTNIALEELSPFAGARKSGTVQHHIRAPSFRESIVPNTLLNFYTRFSGESNSHITLRNSTLHFKVNFLHIYCYAAFILSMELEMTSHITTPGEVWGVTTNCGYCTQPIVDEPMIFDTTKIRGTRFHPIRLCSPGTRANDIIFESLQEFKGDLLIMPDLENEAPCELATYGICQEVIDSTWALKQTIHERYVPEHLQQTKTNVLSTFLPRSHSRDVGLSELKRCNVRTVLDYLVSFVNSTLYSLCPTFNDETKCIWIEMSPSEELPWYGLVHYIYQAGFLHKLLRLVQDESMIPTPSCFHSPTTSTKYIGAACVKIWGWRACIPKLVILTYYKERQVAYHLLNFLRATMWRKLHETLFSLLGRSRRDTPESKNILSQLFCVAYSLAQSYPLAEEAYMTLVERVTETCVKVVPMNAILDCNLEDIYNLFDPDTSTILSPMSYFVHQVYKRMVSAEISITTVLDNLENNFDNIQESLDSCLNNWYIEISYMTLSQCIQSVRSSTNTSNLDEETLRPRTQLKPSEGFLQLPSTKVKFPAPSVYYPTETNPVQTSNYPVFPVFYEQTYSSVSNRSSYQTLGHFNGSPSILFSILNQLGMIRPENYAPGIRVACLSDGLGGFSSILDLLVTSGLFVYHTYPDSNIFEIYPEAVLRKGYTRNTFRYDHLTQGYTNLIHKEVFYYLESFREKYSIVTSDIDAYIMNSPDARNCEIGIVLFYLRNRTENSLLICAVANNHPQVICEVISLLRQYCDHVWLINPLPNNNPMKSYIIAYGGSKPCNVEYFPTSINVSVNTMSKCDKFLKYVYNENTVLDSVNFEDIRISNHLRWKLPMYAGEIGRYGFIRVTEMLNLKLNLDDLVELAPDEVKRIIIKTADTEIRSCKLALKGRDQRLHTYETETRQHRAKVVERLMQLQGLKISISRWQWRAENYRLSCQDIQEEYFDILMDLDVRDRAFPFNNEHYQVNFERDGQTFRYFTRFVGGVRTGIIIVGQFYHSHKELLHHEETR
ncbi:polymerase [Lishi spider virus 1]|uniref:RNA-directed RNA polymerase n=1 Tax=Lishi spider virus 1 TaxID=1608057 RepID=A0A0B5KRA0_9VIRU|nr:polymerase [Lishi spider virus 1]AJG39051.1 polymerase [Lishi spider virus 1]